MVLNGCISLIVSLRLISLSCTKEKPIPKFRYKRNLDLTSFLQMSSNLVVKLHFTHKFTSQPNITAYEFEGVITEVETMRLAGP